MRVLVTGDRNYTDKMAVYNALDEVFDDDPDSFLILGDARGADALALEYAIATDISYAKLVADWETYGKAAGPIRNQKMLDEGPDLVVAFHDDLELSKGTRNMVEKAEKAGVPVRIIGNDNR